ncbi:MAG TPA: outer membrane lipoprotein carrier protein LolA [Burkholderiales bacterium]
MTTGVSALIIALALSHAAPAQSEVRWGLPELMQELRAVKSAHGRFVERKYLAALSAPLELSGTLAYTAPGRLEKRTLQPRAERLLLEGNTLTVEDHKRRRSYALEQNPPVWAFVESIRSTLAGDLETLNRFYDVRLEGERSAWRLTLRPSEPSMQSMVSEIRIGGRGAWLEAIEVLDAGGDRSVMTITRDAS